MLEAITTAITILTKTHTLSRLHNFLVMRKFLTKSQRIFLWKVFLERATRERPSTKWKFAYATKMTVFVAIQKEIPLGGQNVEVRSRFPKNKKIFCLSTNCADKPNNDKLGLFRAVAFQLTGRHNLRDQTAIFFQRYLEHCEVDGNDFKGVPLETINAIEDLIELNIGIYGIEIETDQLVGVLSRRSINKHSRSVTLRSYENHICYTKDLNAVFNCFRCEHCNIIFRKHSNLRRQCQFVVKRSRKKPENLRTNLKKQCSKNFRSLKLEFLKITDFSKSSPFLIWNQFARLKTIPSQTFQSHGRVSINPFQYQYLLYFRNILSFYVIHNQSK